MSKSPSTLLGRVLRRYSVREIRSRKRHGLVGSPQLWHQKRDFQIGFLKANGLRPHHRFLDFGCGTLRGGLPIVNFLERGKYYGIDVRRAAIDEAMREVSEAGLKDKDCTLEVVADLKRWTPGRPFDIVWAFGVLVHLTDEALAAALSSIAGHLDDSGVFYANVHVCPERPDGRWREFPIVHRSLEFYSREAEKAGLVVLDMGSLAAFGHEEHEWKRMLSMTKIG